MDLVKRNAEIVALVKARKMPMRAIAARYRLSTSSISLIAIRHGVHAQAAEAASKLIQRGMPLRHVAQTVGLDYQRLRHLLEKLGVYTVPPPNRRWSGCEVRILRRDYGKPGRSLRTIAAKIDRTCQAVNSKALLLGLSWPLEFRVSAKGTSKLSDQQQAEVLKRLAAGESCRGIAKTFGVHQSTIARLAR
ncbi:MAG: helix-turn-helix domain-containing protein [Hyphomicrobiaceae bacterium]